MNDEMTWFLERAKCLALARLREQSIKKSQAQLQKLQAAYRFEMASEDCIVSWRKAFNCGLALQA